MSTSCFSTATIVRCETLTQLQNGIVFIPVAVQMVFLLAISAFYCHSGRRKHYWLLADGATFYIVTLTDLLSHLIPIARNQLHVFRIFDIVIGALSFVPIIFFLLFILLFANRFYFDAFTGRISVVLKYVLMALIPITIATSLLGSFLGIHYQAFENAEGEMLLAIGFSSSTLQTLFRLFASITLVLLILYQAFFFISSVYIGASLAQERRVGSNFFEGFTMPTMAGIIWLAIGINFGFVESILGFVSGGFPIVLARRLLRMLCRCCLVVGSLQSESASAIIVDRYGRPRSTSQIRAMISNPRHSTFARLSPNAGAFYSTRAAEKLPEGFVPRTIQGGPIPRNQRVTVHYDGRHGPHLELRLSGLDVPPAEELTARFDRRGTIFEKVRSAKPSLTRSLSAIAPRTDPMFDPEAFPTSLRPVLGSRSMTISAEESVTRPARGNPRYNSSIYSEDEDGSFMLTGGHRHFMSASSITSDSLSVVRALAAQFPGLPPRRTASGRRWSMGGGNRRSSAGLSATLENVTEVSEKPETSLSPSNSVKRKPPPTLEATMSELKNTSEESGMSHSSPSDQGKISQSNSMRRRNNHVPPPIDVSQAEFESRISQSIVISDDNENGQPNTPVTAVSTSVAATPTASLSRRRHKPDYSYSTVRSSNTATQSQPTPAMYVGGLASSPDDPGLATDRDVIVANPVDPFEDTDDDQPRYKASQLAGAESGLNRMAARVVEFDRLRRESYLKKPSAVPPRSGAKGKGKAPEMGQVDFPRIAGKPIGGPKPLSALASSSSSSSSPSPSPGSPSHARHVNVAARRGPAYTNPSPTSPLKTFRQQHAHQPTVSQSSVMTRRSHTDREQMQVKHVGLVPTRRTPTPTPSSNSFATRKSMRIDSVDYSASGRSAMMDSEFDTEGSVGASPMRDPGQGPSIASLRGARYRFEGRGWGARGSVSSGLSRVESEAAFKQARRAQEGTGSDMEDNGREDS